MLKAVASAILLAATGACATGAGRAVDASADLVDALGATRGRASLVGHSGSVRVSVAANGMAPGTYGAHLHAVGRCDAPEFTTAGAHWNPTGRQHGRANPAGAHLGDLPNLQVGADGRGRVDFVVADAGLQAGPHPILDGDGAAVVVHAAADDERTDPSGNSGKRILCARFQGSRP